MASRRKSSLSRTLISQGAQEEDAISDPYSTSFNPSNLKVVQLRALLAKHEIAVPSTARKADLIRAYEEEIRPIRGELEAARNRDRNIRPSAEGVTIIKADAYPVFKEDSSSGNESDSALPPSALSHPGTPRRGRRSVSWAGDVSGAEDDEEPGDASTFSINNPFQSPRAVLDLDSAGKKNARKSESAIKSSPPREKAKQPRSSTSTLLSNYMDPSIAANTPPRLVGYAARNSKGRVAGIAAFKHDEGYDESGVDADISRDAYEDPPSSPTAQKRKRSARKSSSLSSEEGNVQTARSFVWLIFSAVTLSWWIWFASESKTVGFCDMGRDSNALLDERTIEQRRTQQAIDDGDDGANMTLRVPTILRPSCLACPPHAVCQGGAMIGCESSDYAIRFPILAHVPIVKAVIPLSLMSPSCAPDQQKVLLAADLADEIEKRLRIWKGDVQCKRKSTRFDTGESLYAIPKMELYQQLEGEAEKGGALTEHPEDYFKELWDLATDDLYSTDRMGESFRGLPLLYAKRSGIGIGFGCQIQLLIESIWQRIRFWLFTAAFLSITGLWLRHRLRYSQTRQGQTRELVSQTLIRLEQVKLNWQQQGGGGGGGGGNKGNLDGGGGGGFLSINQLRDDILRNESKESQRQKIWKQVVKKVEANTNVRTRQAKVKGEWARVWEWVGALEGKAGRETKDKDNNVIINNGNGRLHSADI